MSFFREVITVVEEGVSVDQMSFPDTSIIAIGFSADDRYIYTLQGNGELKSWNGLTGEMISTEVISSSPIYLAAFSHAGSRIIFVDSSSQLNQVSVEHPTTDTLLTKVSECITDRGIRTSLTAKINNAQWGAFINEVEAQRGKKISEECAVDLISMAQYLLENE